MKRPTTSVADDHDLERRLRLTFSEVMPLLVDDDYGAAPARPLDAPRPSGRRGRGWRWATVAAAAAVVAIGVRAMISLTGDDAETTPTGIVDTTSVTTTSSTTVPQTAGPPAIEGAVTPISAPDMSGDRPEPWWDPIRIAADVVGWYDIETAALDGALLQTLGERNSWTPEYAAGFYECVGWSTDHLGPICDELVGGSMVEIVTYGERDGGGSVSVGTILGPFEPPDVAWTLAEGSLWGYGAFMTPPDPTEVPLSAATGYLYRNGDGAYLAWQVSSGRTVWLKANGFDDADLVTLANSVTPVDLPHRLPISLRLDTAPTNQGPFSGVDTLSLAWVDGHPCAGFAMWVACTPLDQGPTLIAGQAAEGLRPVVAAVAPTGTEIGLVVELYELGEQAVDLSFSGDGFDAYVFHPGFERLLAARLVEASTADPVVTQEVSFGLEAMLNGFAPDVVDEGRTAGVAWVVVRQDPAAIANAGTAPPSQYLGDQYCWLLFQADGGFAPMCPPAERPTSELGDHADYHSDLDLVELGSRVLMVTCADVEMPIVTDDRFDGRRFAVVSCPNPLVTTDGGEGSTP